MAKGHNQDLCMLGIFRFSFWSCWVKMGLFTFLPRLGPGEERENTQ